jgi:hypothetical protein
MAFAALTTLSFAQTFPTVVASVKLTGQTTTIPQTVLFTPTTDGMFRINAYMVTTVPKTDGTKPFWSLALQWTDDAHNWLFVDAVATPAYQITNSNIFLRTNDWPLTFWVRAGTPIIYAVQSTGGSALGSTYELFATLEQLM